MEVPDLMIAVLVLGKDSGYRGCRVFKQRQHKGGISDGILPKVKGFPAYFIRDRHHLGSDGPSSRVDRVNSGFFL